MIDLSTWLLYKGANRAETQDGEERYQRLLQNNPDRALNEQKEGK
jgi:hypothetical protein